MNRKILVLSNVSFLSPALRYRIIYPLQLLASKNGVSWEVKSFFSVKTEKKLSSNKDLSKLFFSMVDLVKFILVLIMVLFSKKEIDKVIVKNYIFPFGGLFMEKIVHFFLEDKSFYYDIDDAIYLNQTRSQNKNYAFLRNVDAKVRFWLSKSHKIVTSNEYIVHDLVERYHIEKGKVVTFLAAPFREQYFGDYSEIIQEKSLDKINIVWLGSPHTQKNLKVLDDLFQSLSKYTKRPVNFTLIGVSSDFKAYKNFNNVRCIEWSPENEYKYMREAHFGLNPLQNNEFERRKSAFKVIQYYRAGIIPIVSDVGINRFLVKQYGGYCITDDIKSNSIGAFINDTIKNFTDKSIAIYENTKHLSVENNAEIIRNTMG